MYSTKHYQKVKKLWDNGVRQKFFRCAKELGIYKKVKVNFGTNTPENFLRHYVYAINYLSTHRYVSNARPNKYKYVSRKLYKNSKRHMLMLVCSIFINKLYLSIRTKNDYLEELDKFIFKGHNLIAKIREIHYQEVF